MIRRFVRRCDSIMLTVSFAAVQVKEAIHLFERASELMFHSPYPSWEMGYVALEQE